MAEENKFPSEVIDLPSKGKVYPEDSPLSSGKIDIKYMTAKEEDILTSQNLITKGVVIDRLLDSLILTEGIKSQDLIVGDKNAVMVAARILAYGPEYTCQVVNPKTNIPFEHTFNLADCPFKTLEKDIENEETFTLELPASKDKIKFKLLTGKDEEEINTELSNIKKMGGDVSKDLTTRLKHTITSVNGDESKGNIYNYVENMLARDSLYLRQEVTKVSPDIELSQEVQIEGEPVKVDIPVTVNFFWPNTET
tara:strand:- start:1251 stop:2006 length:756 start_codon:yes stop_codon:yes gene_type:complete